MKFGVFSDPHCHNHKKHSKIIDGMNCRLRNCINAITQATKEMAARDVDIMLVCGDIFHVRGNLRESVLNAVANTFADGYENYGMRYYMIPGNHDMENYRAGSSALDVLGFIPGVTVIKEPDILDVEGKMVFAVPYIDKAVSFMDCYENMVALHPDIDIVLMHQYIDDFTPSVMEKTGITVEYLAKGLKPEAFVFSGHYHENIVDKAPSGVSVINVGALLAQKYGDDGEYGAFYFDFDNPVDNAFLPSDMPRFLTLERLPRAVKKLEKLVKGHYVKIKTDTIAKLERMKDRCLGAGALGVESKLVKDLEAKDPTKIIEISSDKDMIKKYLEHEDSGVPPEKVPQVFELFKTLCLGAVA